VKIDLSGRTAAIVSGSTSGIGFAIARGLVDSGAAQRGNRTRDPQPRPLTAAR
jgi:NAD(P)-dependent dehydrogenase (short-subunit alcohol dehydrogenase family)